MESTKKLQVTISTVSIMLLKGLHGATSMASCTKQENQAVKHNILFILHFKMQHYKHLKHIL